MGNQGNTSVVEYDAIIVGAGFAGLYMLHKLRELGSPARVLEAGDGVGGTWYWNRYPGARCDIESLEYQFSFSDELQREWNWTERYAGQPEILDYANHVADRFELRGDIQLETRVISAVFDEDRNRWAVETDRGDSFSARYCIMATGCLSLPKLPELSGIDAFRGNTYHTARWPHEGVDLTGQRVAVIGTGSSGIQSIPVIAEQAAELHVFQRTPNFTIPAQNASLTREYTDDYKEKFPEIRRVARASGFGIAIPARDDAAVDVGPEERLIEYQSRWDRGGLGFLLAFNDLVFDTEANETAADFVRSKIREQVDDPAIAETLSPTNYPLGAKRLCIDTGYYEAFNRANVRLNDLDKNPIEEITATGIRTVEAAYEFDSIVFATGFDAMTGALDKIDIRGRGGERLRDRWEAGPRTYLGLQIAGFPNLFTIAGPGSPSVLSNMMIAIEQNVEWIASCIDHLREQGIDCIEATAEAEDDWVAQVNEAAEATLYPRANSWYVGSNVPGKPRVFMPYIGGLGVYEEKCNEAAANGYQGFALTAGEVPATT